MNKKDLIDAVAESADLSKVQAEAAVTATFNSITDVLAKEGDVAIPGFGNFVVKQRAARQGRNPQTGATIDIAASKAVGFKVSSVLKKTVNS